jgi:hypothetical protein
MNITISFHIFGSVQGYTTLAFSETVTEQEVKQLEQYSFGQTNNLHYLNSLETNPAIISRRLNSGRWAITRVKMGPNDEYSRRTLLFITAIVSENDWLDVLKCNIKPLIITSDIWEWNGSNRISEKQIEVGNIQLKPIISDPAKKKALILLSAIETNTNKTIIVNDADYDIDVINILNQLLPHKFRNTFSYTVRALSDKVKVSLISLSQEAQVTHPKNCAYLVNHEIQTESVYTEMIGSLWDNGGQPPWAFIDRCEDFLQLDEENPSGITNKTPRRITTSSANHRTKHFAKKTKFLVAFILCAGLCAVTSYMLGKVIINKRAIDNIISKATAFLENNAPRHFEKNDREEKIEECKKIIAAIDVIGDNKNTILSQCKSDLNKWLIKTEEINSTYDSFDSLLSNCRLLPLNDSPNEYPDPNTIKNVIQAEKNLSALANRHNTSDLEAVYATKVGDALSKMHTYITNCGLLLDEIHRRYNAECYKTNLNEPNCYDHRKYNAFVTSRDTLKQIESGNSLRNAKESPEPLHKGFAIKLYNDISDTIEKYNQCTKKMDKYLLDSKELVKSAQNILHKKLKEDPNSKSDPNEMCIRNTIKEIEKAKKLNPAMFEIDKDINKIESDIVGYRKKDGSINSLPKKEKVK